MVNADETKPENVEISDIERGRIFVTMNATFKDEERCRVAMETIVSDAHAAYGVTSHCWFRSEDGTSLFVVEQYADEGALRQAVRRFTSARLSFFRSIKVKDVSIYGDVSPFIKAMFCALRPTYMKYAEGYSKPVANTKEAGIKDFERNRVFIATNATSSDRRKSTEMMAGLVEAAHAEPGTNSHFWTRSKDGEALSALEQYADEKTLIDRLSARPTSIVAFAEFMDVGDATIYGAESSEVKEMFAPLNPTYMNYYGGYSK